MKKIILSTLIVCSMTTAMDQLQSEYNDLEKLSPKLESARLVSENSLLESRNQSSCCYVNNKLFNHCLSFTYGLFCGAILLGTAVIISDMD